MPGTTERVLVTGTGVTGGEVLRRLVVSNVAARALVRNPQRAESYKNMGVELVEGDFSDPEAWKRALGGVTKVFSITIAHRDAETWNTVFLKAAQQAGIERIVRLSGMSVSPSSEATFHRLMGRCDEALKASGLT